ncbi:MAG: LysE family transporter [Saprospiraceae bacterium]
MSYILEGIIGGLSLSILLGPIFIILIQTGIEKGVRAGVYVGTGIWTSDLFIILGFYIFLKELKEVVEDPEFIFWFGAIGGAVLVFFGIYLALRKTLLDYSKIKISTLKVLGYWTKGFLVNTFNPFTFIFWMGFITSFIISRELNQKNSMLLLGSIFITIVVTDTLKVVLAKMIRTKLSEALFSKINKVAGIVVSLFGLLIFYRCVFPEESAALFGN